MISFVNDGDVSLGTDQLVWPGGDIASIGTAIEQAGRLARLLESETARIEDAVRTGYEGGLEQGRTDGYEAALEHIAVKLLELSREADAQRQRLQESTADLALRITAKIAEGIAPADTLAALARSAARQLVPREPVTLHVAPSLVEAVREAFAADTSPSRQIVEVAGDPSLAESDCVLETEFGRIRADLARQLQAFREKFDAA